MSVKTLAVVQSSDSNVVKISKGKTVVLQTDHKTEKSFNFDGSFIGSCSEEIYQNHLAKVAQDALSGFNVNITCFGANGSGTNHLLHGVGFSSQSGIVPMLIEDLFSRMNSLNNMQHLVSASMLQVNQKGTLFDLLNPHSRSMKVKHNDKLGVYVDDVSSIVCSNAEEACNVYTEGYKVETSLKTSARDVVYTLYIAQRQQGDTSAKGYLSKITIFDLAGHESLADNIGIKSLFKSLGKGKVSKESLSSPTLQLLHDAMVNSASSTVIACVSGEEKDVHASSQTLEMAKSVSGSRLSPKRNSGDLEELLSHLRKDIKIVRDRMIQQNPQKNDIARLEELLDDLTAAKRTCWDQRIALSNQYIDERRTNLADRGLLWVLESSKASNHEKIKEIQKRVDKLSSEYKEQRKSSDKVKEDLKLEIEQYTKLVDTGRSNENDTKARVTKIQQMKESYKKETDKTDELRKMMKAAKEQLRKEKEAGLDVASFNFEMTIRKLEEDRARMMKENEQLIDEELEKMKVEVDHEKAELEMRASSGDLPQPSNEELVKNGISLTSLKAEKSVITTQLDVLKKQSRQLEDHIRVLADKHVKEAEIQQLQNLQTFRAYREVFEEFKVDLENRWRGLLDDAIQDAVFLNSRNNELSQENQKLKLEVNELKDALSLTGSPLGKKSAVTGIAEA